MKNRGHLLRVGDKFHLSPELDLVAGHHGYSNSYTISDISNGKVRVSWLMVGSGYEWTDYDIEDVIKAFDSGSWICLRLDRRQKLERIANEI